MVGMKWMVLYLLVNYQGMVTGQVLRQDMMDLLVGQLADDVKAENAGEALSELVKILIKNKDDKKTLTNKIENMLKKFKAKTTKRILPLGIIYLLKAKMKVKGKKKILEKVLKVILEQSQEESEEIVQPTISIPLDNYQQTLELEWVPPTIDFSLNKIPETMDIQKLGNISTKSSFLQKASLSKSEALWLEKDVKLVVPTGSPVLVNGPEPQTSSQPKFEESKIVLPLTKTNLGTNLSKTTQKPGKTFYYTMFASKLKKQEVKKTPVEKTIENVKNKTEFDFSGYSNPSGMLIYKILSNDLNL